MCRVDGVPHDHAYVVWAHRWEPSPLGRRQSVAGAIQWTGPAQKNSTGLLTT